MFVKVCGLTNQDQVESLDSMVEYVGFIFYPLVKIAQGKRKEVNVVMYVLALLFIIFFIVEALA